MPPKGEIVDYPSSFSGRCGEQVHYDITIKNVGDADGVFHIRIKDANDNVICSPFYSQPLEPGEEHTFRCDFRLTYPSGNYTIELYDETTRTIDDVKKVPADIQGNGSYGLSLRGVYYPSRVTVESNVQVTVVVDGNDCCTLGKIQILDENGDVVASASTGYPVCPGWNLNVPLSFKAPSEPGRYTYTLNLYCSDCGNKLQASRSLSIDVYKPGEPFFIIDGVQYPSSAAPNTDVTVTVTVKNVGDTGGNVDVRILSGGEVIAHKEVYVPANSQNDVPLSVTTPSCECTWYLYVETYNDATNHVDDRFDFSIYVTGQGGGGGSLGGGGAGSGGGGGGVETGSEETGAKEINAMGVIGAIVITVLVVLIIYELLSR